MVTEQMEEYEKYHAREYEKVQAQRGSGERRFKGIQADFKPGYIYPPGGNKPLFIDLDGVEGLVGTDVELLQLCAMGAVTSSGTRVFIFAPRDLERYHTLTFKYKTQAEAFVLSLKAILKKHNMIVEL